MFYFNYLLFKQLTCCPIKTIMWYLGKLAALEKTLFKREVLLPVVAQSAPDEGSLHHKSLCSQG